MNGHLNDCDIQGSERKKMMLHKHYLKHSCYLGFFFSLQNVGFLKLIDSDLNLCLHQVFSTHTTVGMKKKKVSTWDSSFKSILTS